MLAQRENTPSLIPRAQSVADMDGTWWVAQTRPQYEKKLSRELKANGIDHFLPLITVKRIYKNGNSAILVLPWFPMYVFVNGDVEARYVAACSPAVSAVRNVSDQPRLHRELLNVERCCPQGIVVPQTESIRAGMKCVVKQGHALAGAEGWVDRVTGLGHAFIGITILGDTNPVEIDPIYLEPA